MEIALIAHDGKKAEMVQFLNTHKDRLKILLSYLPELRVKKLQKQDLKLNLYYQARMAEMPK